jgi:hypothetical protein
MSPATHGAQQSPDAEFIRRVYLDLLDALPTDEEIKVFLADADPKKRSRLLDTVLDAPTLRSRLKLSFLDRTGEAEPAVTKTLEIESAVVDSVDATHATLSVTLPRKSTRAARPTADAPAVAELLGEALTSSHARPAAQLVNVNVAKDVEVLVYYRSGLKYGVTGGKTLSDITPGMRVSLLISVVGDEVVVTSIIARR